MPNRNSGLAELAQMMQLVNGGGQDNAAAQQQHAGLQWMQMQQQGQQRAAEQGFHQQQLELQKQHYGNERDYQEGMLRGHENAARIAAQERRAATIGRVLDQHLGSGGKLTDFVGQGLIQSLDPESAKLITQGAAQAVAQKQLALLQPLLMAHSVNPSDKKLRALVDNQMESMGTMDSTVQQFIPWDALNQQVQGNGVGGKLGSKFEGLLADIKAKKAADVAAKQDFSALRDVQNEIYSDNPWYSKLWDGLTGQTLPKQMSIGLGN